MLDIASKIERQTNRWTSRGKRTHLTYLQDIERNWSRFSWLHLFLIVNILQFTFCHRQACFENSHRFSQNVQLLNNMVQSIGQLRSIRLLRRHVNIECSSIAFVCSIVHRCRIDQTSRSAIRLHDDRDRNETFPAKTNFFLLEQCHFRRPARCSLFLVDRPYRMSACSICHGKRRSVTNSEIEVMRVRWPYFSCSTFIACFGMRFLAERTDVWLGRLRVGRRRSRGGGIVTGGHIRTTGIFTSR